MVQRSLSQSVNGILSGYRRIEPHIRHAIAAQFGIQLVNSSFFLLLNYYMTQVGYADYEVSEVLSYRFLAVFWLAFPLGLFIKGRRLKPFFYVSAIAVPLLSQVILLAIGQQWTTLLHLATTAWGLAFTCIQVTIMPFILLNGRRDYHSEAFSLSFLSFGLTMAGVGLLHFLLSRLNPAFFTEETTLRLISLLSLLSLFFVSRIKIKENVSQRLPWRQIREGYDWPLILRASLPTLIIAVGAGFTIPVINLFFLHVHGIPSQTFSLVSSATFLLVTAVVMLMPYIRRNFGYQIAITWFQSSSVMALFLLATTEYYSQWSYAAWVAFLFFIIRQPLMSAATPMTNELAMYFVGPRNQEIMSALSASIWSGSWYVSMKLFGWLRQLQLSYVNIFLITVAMYAAGIIWYAFLIRAYERRQQQAAPVH